jgi:hypothetical protein
MTGLDLTMQRELLYAGLGFPRLLRTRRAMRAATVALLDGPVDATAPHFARVSAVSRDDPARTQAPSDHATAMASLLVVPDADDRIHLLCWPTLGDAPAAGALCAQHLLEACAARPDFILLGFEFLGTAPAFLQAAQAALDAAHAAGIPVLAPAGNHRGAIAHPLYAHPALVPVTAAGSAWGPQAARGIGAPGHAVPVVLAGGRATTASGTSFAAALAGAALASLVARSPLPAARLCASLRCGAGAATRTLPPDLDVWRAFQHLSRPERKPS